MLGWVSQCRSTLTGAELETGRIDGVSAKAAASSSKLPVVSPCLPNLRSDSLSKGTADATAWSRLYFTATGNGNFETRSV